MAARMWFLKNIIDGQKKKWGSPLRNRQHSKLIGEIWTQQRILGMLWEVNFKTWWQLAKLMGKEQEEDKEIITSTWMVWWHGLTGTRTTPDLRPIIEVQPILFTFTSMALDDMCHDQWLPNCAVLLPPSPQYTHIPLVYVCVLVVTRWDSHKCCTIPAVLTPMYMI